MLNKNCDTLQKVAKVVTMYLSKTLLRLEIWHGYSGSKSLQEK